MEQCEICGNDVQGELFVEELTIGDTEIIAIQETPDRNWICCDSCNLLVCHTCASQPKTGYCDRCIKKYGMKFDPDGQRI